jgi:uncharacterized protein
MVHDSGRVDIADKVAFLRRAANYPHAPASVAVKQTHMSWVFLAGDLVFKLKKPVRHPYLDFSTLAARERNCREELRLNQRLAPGVYLDVVPLRLGGGGELTFGGEGPIVDWLVKMRRLPVEGTLDWRIRRRKLQRREVEPTARHIVNFYAASPPAEVTADWVIRQFTIEHERNSVVLMDRRFDLDHGRTADILAAMKAALHSCRAFIETRVAQRAYVEGHGDLRPEHVYVHPEPVILDCLEFNRDMRLLDPFDELAFLDLECERLGAAWVGRIFLDMARDTLASAPPQRLIDFYRASRGLLRARLALAHLLEPSPRAPSKWQPRARQYLSLAAAALDSYARHGTRKEVS